MLKKFSLSVLTAALMFSTTLVHADNRCLRLIDQRVDGQKLDLGWCGLTAEDMPAILSYLKQHPEIHDIDISAGNFDTTSLKKLTAKKAITSITFEYATADLAEVLIQDTHLRNLDISQNQKIGDSIAKDLAQNTTLTSLNLELTNASDATTVAAAANPNLMTLALGFNEVTDKGVQVLARKSNVHTLTIGDNRLTEAGLLAVAKMPYLENLDAAYLTMTPAVITTLSNMNSLNELHCFRCNITDTAVTAFGNNTKIKILDIRDNSISDKGAIALSRLSGLETLVLDNNPISDAGVLAFINHPNLSELSLASDSITSASGVVFGRIPKLQSLSLTSKNFDDQGIQALNNNKMLTELYLSADITNDSTVTILHMPRLKALGLDELLYSHDELQAIAENKTLEFLDLRSVIPLDAASAKILAANTSIKNLWLIASITDAGVVEIAKNPHIKALDLRINELTDASAAALVANTTLQELLLDGDKMSKDAVAQLQNTSIPFLYVDVFSDKLHQVKKSHFKQYYLQSHCKGLHKKSKMCGVLKSN